ncbi:hypothetical protein [Gymnodinialimonas sp.]
MSTMNMLSVTLIVLILACIMAAVIGVRSAQAETRNGTAGTDLRTVERPVNDIVSGPVRSPFVGTAEGEHDI